MTDLFFETERVVGIILLLFFYVDIWNIWTFEFSCSDNDFKPFAWRLNSSIVAEISSAEEDTSCEDEVISSVVLLNYIF